MVFERRYFSLTAVGDQLFAIGGAGDYRLSSSEVLTQGEGWREEPKLDMGAAKQNHCSVALGSWLYIIGGHVEETSGTKGYISNQVEAYDTSSTSAASSWVSKAHMIGQRYGHGCHSGLFLEEEGIFVAGGTDSDDYLASVEFYFAASDRWQTIGSLNVARRDSPMTMVGSTVVLSGGRNPAFLTSVETWNGTSWAEMRELKVGRKAHAGVTVEAGKLKCKTEE